MSRTRTMFASLVAVLVLRRRATLAYAPGLVTDRLRRDR